MEFSVYCPSRRQQASTPAISSITSALNGEKRTVQGERETEAKSLKLTLNIILSERVRGLVVVHQLHHMQEIFLAESLEPICHFLHVHLRASASLAFKCGSGGRSGAGLRSYFPWPVSSPPLSRPRHRLHHQERVRSASVSPATPASDS